MKLTILFVCLPIFLFSNFNPQSEEEEIYDTLLDCFFIGMDIGEIIATGGTSGWVSLGADLGCLVTPGATGSGHTIRVGKTALKGNTAIKGASKGAAKFKFSYRIKNLKNIRIAKQFVADNLQHAIDAHVETVVKSCFKGMTRSNARKKLMKLAREAFSKVGTDAAQVFVRPNGSISIGVIMDKTIGTVRGMDTNIMFIHCNPNYKTGHKFSMYPVDMNYLINFRGLKKSYL